MTTVNVSDMATSNWLNAQAATKGYSDVTTARYNEVVAANKAATGKSYPIWVNGYERLDPNANSLNSGSLGPGTFQSNGNPPNY